MYCMCFVGGKPGHRDYPSEPQKHLVANSTWFQELSTAVSSWVCVLVIYCNMGYFDQGSVDCTSFSCVSAEQPRRNSYCSIFSLFVF